MGDVTGMVTQAMTIYQKLNAQSLGTGTSQKNVGSEKNSVSGPDSGVFWIRFRNPDPDSGAKKGQKC